ncbi:MAG: hypothetical protein ACOCXJ_01730, partial [Planctomycetota bacterium]
MDEHGPVRSRSIDTLEQPKQQCIRCGAFVDDEALRSGSAIRVLGRLICPACHDSPPVRRSNAQGMPRRIYRVEEDRHPDHNRYTFITAAHLSVHRRYLATTGTFPAPPLPADGSGMHQLPSGVPSLHRRWILLGVGITATLVLVIILSAVLTDPPGEPERQLAEAGEADAPAPVRPVADPQLLAEKEAAAATLDAIAGAVAEGAIAEATDLAEGLSLPRSLAFENERRRLQELRERIATAGTDASAGPESETEEPPAVEPAGKTIERLVITTDATPGSRRDLEARMQAIRIAIEGGHFEAAAAEIEKLRIPDAHPDLLRERFELRRLLARAVVAAQEEPAADPASEDRTKPTVDGSGDDAALTTTEAAADAGDPAGTGEVVETDDAVQTARSDTAAQTDPQPDTGPADEAEDAQATETSVADDPDADADSGAATPADTPAEPASEEPAPEADDPSSGDAEQTTTPEPPPEPRSVIAIGQLRARGAEDLDFFTDADKVPDGLPLGAGRTILSTRRNSAGLRMRLDIEDAGALDEGGLVLLVHPGDSRRQSLEVVFIDQAGAEATLRVPLTDMDWQRITVPVAQAEPAGDFDPTTIAAVELRDTIDSSLAFHLAGALQVAGAPPRAEHMPVRDRSLLPLDQRKLLRRLQRIIAGRRNEKIVSRSEDLDCTKVVLVMERAFKDDGFREAIRSRLETITGIPATAAVDNGDFSEEWMEDELPALLAERKAQFVFICAAGQDA